MPWSSGPGFPWWSRVVSNNSKVLETNKSFSKQFLYSHFSREKKRQKSCLVIFQKIGLFVVWVSPKKPVASRHKPKSRRANSPGSTPFGRSTGPSLLEKEKTQRGSYFINFSTWKSQMTQMACHNLGIETDALDIRVLIHSMLEQHWSVTA